MSPEENSYSFLLWPKMMTATSTEQSTESSCAFLNRPPLRLRKVLWQVSDGWLVAGGGSTYTERFRSSLMALISIFLRPMVDGNTRRQSSWSGDEGCAYFWGGRGGRLVEGLWGTKEDGNGTSLRGSGLITKTFSVSAPATQEPARVRDVGGESRGCRWAKKLSATPGLYG